MTHNAKLKDEVAQKDAELEELREAVLVQVDDLSSQMERLKARANRVDAMGQRLVKIGEMESLVPDFHMTVGMSTGMGGPDLGSGAESEGLLQSLERVSLEMDHSDTRLAKVEGLLHQWKHHLSFIPSGKPIQGRLTSHYGYRSDPFRQGKRFHSGVDFKARTGDTVSAVASGTVIYSGNRSGYGYTVDIDHGNGYMTRYAHNSRLVKKVGNEVSAGEEVAKAGSTGRSTGPHVHFEVWKDGKPVNPGKFIQKPPHNQMSAETPRPSERAGLHQG